MLVKTRQLTLTAIFLAIILLFAFTPFGFINLGFIKATIIHVPVIIGSIILGPKIGALLGGAFGLTSLAVNTMTPSLLSFAFSPFIPVLGTNHGSFWALIICFVPRILVGVVPYYFYKLLQKKVAAKPNYRFAILFLAGVIGALVNTILVMNLIYFVFHDAYAQAKGIEIGKGVYTAVLAVIFANGIPEALVAGISTSAVCTALFRINKNK